jgi:pyruvate kinase
MLNNALAIALQKNYICNTDRVVTVAGIPINSPVMLNTIRVHVISTILGKGKEGFGPLMTGKIVKAREPDEAALRIEGNGDDILLTKSLDQRFKPLLPKVKGILLEEFSTLSREDILVMNADITVISGIPDALATFESDLLVSIDGEERLIYEGIIAQQKRSDSEVQA